MNYKSLVLHSFKIYRTKGNTQKVASFVQHQQLLSGRSGRPSFAAQPLCRTFTRQIPPATKEAFALRNSWLTFGVGALCGCGLSYLVWRRKTQNRTPRWVPTYASASNVEDASSPTNLRLRYNFFAAIVKEVAPAVVCLEIIGNVPTFFGMAESVSTGSGFVVRPDGLILTNFHVVGDRRGGKIKVRLHDGKELIGVVQDVDRHADLATVKVPAQNLPTLKLANSDEAAAGEFVMSMGSPLTLSNSVTIGVISNVKRSLNQLMDRPSGFGGSIDYIQTDAAINIGNSGGPLVNLDGEVVGVNSMTVAPASGISFAIPSNYAAKFLEKSSTQPKKEGDSWLGKLKPEAKRRRVLGVTMMALTPEAIGELQMRNTDFPRNVTHGVLIHGLYIGSPAHRSGVQPGDVITHINGRVVSSASDVLDAVSSDDCLELKILRNKDELTVKITDWEEL